MTPATPSTLTALALRADFDQAFAKAPREAGPDPTGMLAIRIAGEPYALRLEQVGGLHADRRIMPLPSSVPALRGVAGFRGQIVPVYDLALLLGHARSAAPRWLVLVRCEQALALAFDQFEAHFTAAPDQVMSGAQLPERDHLCDTVQGSDVLRPVIDLPSLHDTLQRQAGLALQQRSKPP